MKLFLIIILSCVIAIPILFGLLLLAVDLGIRIFLREHRKWGQPHSDKDFGIKESSKK